MAGIAIQERYLVELEEMGVRDSKTLTPLKRTSLYGEILKICDKVSTVEIHPHEIDAVVSLGKKYRKLNYLEALYFAKVIDKLEADMVIVDACDSSPERFRDNIMANLKSRCKVHAAHKADRDHRVVSAASIVAKVERDREVEKLRQKFGNFGSGYPSDPLTRSYFTRWLEDGKHPPEWVRKSWRSWKRYEQSLLASF